MKEAKAEEIENLMRDVGVEEYPRLGRGDGDGGGYGGDTSRGDQELTREMVVMNLELEIIIHNGDRPQEQKIQIYNECVLSLVQWGTRDSAWDVSSMSRVTETVGYHLRVYMFDQGGVSV